MALLFLDFDGVLHPDAAYRPRNKPLALRGPGSLFMHAPILEAALALHPEIQVILSTSWVRELGFSRTLKKMPQGLRDRVNGATWHRGMVNGYSGGPYTRHHDPFSWMTRFQQIDWYVRRHDVQNWLAIDDLHSGQETWPEDLAHRLVLTQGPLGLGCPAAQAELFQKMHGLNT